MRIYLASSWRNPSQPAIVALLRQYGHEVYDFRNPPESTGFAWSSISPDWQRWSIGEYRRALAHPLAVARFKSDFEGMNKADCCVLVLPCGRSAHAEAGYMAGEGKAVYVLSLENQTEPELMYKLFDGVYGTITELLEELARCAAEDLEPSERKLDKISRVIL